MSTHALIGLRIAEGRILAIYLQMDGYLSQAGYRLVHYWNTLPRIQALLALGDLKILGQEIGAPHNMHARPRPAGTETWCRAFARDSAPDYWVDPVQDGDWAAVCYADLVEFLADGRAGWAEYAYLYEGNRWVVYLDCREPPRDLRRRLRRPAAEDE